MKIFGTRIPFTGGVKNEKALSSVGYGRGGWLPIIKESYGGAWQQNVEINRDTALTYFAVFSCMTLIARDISKLGLQLVARGSDGIWTETEREEYSPVLRKPNSYQNRIQFFEHYFLSKLSNGNVYVLKERNNRNVVVKLHVLDPQRVQPLVSPGGEVFYQLASDDLASIENDIIVPAYEIIHDRMNCLFHPLVGLSPLVAAGVAAMQGSAIQSDSTNFFNNRAVPGGILSAPGSISDETAQRLKEYWEGSFSGNNAGKIAVLGDGLKFNAMRVTATDAQMIETLKWTAENVCSVFHVPPYKIGIGDTPSYNNIQALNVEYYSQALQSMIEEAELCIDEGLAMPENLGAEFVVNDLLRMDAASQMDVLEKSKGKLTVNEQRKRLGEKAVEGGDTVYLQEQDHSLAWLSRRDAMPIEGQETAAPPPAQPDNTDELEAAKAMSEIYKGLANV